MTDSRDVEAARLVTDYLRVLKKHLWLITGIFLVTVITVGIWTFLEVPIYSATATVLIDPEPPKVLNIQEVAPMGVSGWDPNYYPTQYEIIKSKPVLDRAIDALGLKQRMPGLAGAREPHRAVLGGLSVEPKRNTRLIQIRYDNPDPALAAEVANAIAAAYVQYNLD